MSCRLFGDKPLPELMSTYWSLKNNIEWNLNQNAKVSILENGFENVIRKIGGHLFRTGKAVTIFLSNSIGGGQKIIFCDRMW